MSVSRTSYTMRVISRSCSIKTGSSPIRWHAAQPLRSQPQPLLAYLQHSHYSSSSSPTSSSTSSIPRPLTNRTSAPLAATEQDPNFSHLPKIRPPKPEYQITFTCDPCGTRSSHKISKQGYHKGSVLISCPECKNRHVISDHLGIFGDRNITIEDLMKERGQLVKKGTLAEEGGDIEFWADESSKK